MNLKKPISTALVFLATISITGVWADNPIVPDVGMADPHIRIYNNKAYLYATRDADRNAKDFMMPDWKIWSSDDLIHWTLERTISIVDIVRETNQALHENDKAYYTIPDSKATIAQELLLFENNRPDDIEKIADSLFSKTRITVKIRWSDSVLYEKFVGQLKQMFNKELDGVAQVTITGLAALLARTIPAALHSMTKSYVIALVIITILMLMIVGNVKLGLISMCPNLLPIFMVMGLISLSGTSLDINTLFIGSIAIGLVVDDTIHFMYNFRKYLDETGDPRQAIRETFLGTGRALLITSIVLSMNFFVLVTATLTHSVKFGFFTGIVIILALLSDFLLAPALLFLATKKDN